MSSGGTYVGRKVLKINFFEMFSRFRKLSKDLFNPQFGSVFRTYHNPTYFFRRLHRLADLYMSSIVNLLNYSDAHVFYPRRWALPHEVHYGAPWRSS